MTTTTTRLTDEDRQIIAKARELAEALTSEAVREVTGCGPVGPALVFIDAFGRAQVMLGDLADLAERLGDDRV